MYLNGVIRCIRTSFYTKMSDELLHGLTLEERVDKTRAIFERILRDGRLCEFEPEAAVDGEFQAFFFGCERESFACQLIVNGAGRSYMKAECYLEGQVKHSMALTSEWGVNHFVEGMVERVGRFMRRRADLLFVQQQMRRIEIRGAIERNRALLGAVDVRTYQYGLTSWNSLLNQRGPPTVHVVANDEDRSVQDIPMLVFTCPHAPAIKSTCQLHVNTLSFMTDVEVSMRPFVNRYPAGMDV